MSRLLVRSFVFGCSMMKVEPDGGDVGDDHGARRELAPSTGDPAKGRVAEEEERREQARLRHPPRREGVALVPQPRRRRRRGRRRAGSSETVFVLVFGRLPRERADSVSVRFRRSPRGRLGEVVVRAPRDGAAL